MFRLLAGKKPSDRVRVEDLSKKFNMMSMNQMASYHVLVETFNIMNFGSSEKIRQKLTPASTYSRSLTVPLFKKTSCRSFSFYASRLWNTLPMDITTRALSQCTDKSDQTKRLNTFKREVKRWILDGGVPFK